MLRKVFMDIGLNFVGFLWLVVPVIVVYGTDIIFPPLMLTWMVPFYLVIINIGIAEKRNNKFCLWRILHCSLILASGYYISYKYIAYCHLLDSMTELLLYYAFIISLIIVVMGVFLYQLLYFIRWIYNKRVKSVNEKE